MNVVAFDTETCLFRPGVMAPELVCVTYQRSSWAPGTLGAPGHLCTDGPHILHVNDPRCLLEVHGWLEGDDLLVGHHVVYDLAVACAQWPELVPLVFAKYDRDQITCTKIRQQLLDIAAGQFRGHFQDYTKVKVFEDGTSAEVKGARWVKHSYDLDSLVFRSAGRRLQKEATVAPDGTVIEPWRLRYGELLGTPVKDWPQEAVTYPLEDARATLDVFLAQEAHVDYIPDQFRQARAAWALHLTSLWGLRTHAPGVDALEKATLASLADIEKGLVEAGLVRHDGSRDTKKAAARMREVCAREGLTLRLTDKGGVSLDADACEASGDDLLEDYAALTSLKAVVNKDIPVLRAGTEHPVHTSFGLAGSGRSTSSKPNVQNPRRLPGIREAFVPRKGKVFATADFSGLELHTLAQVCISLFGKSELAKVLNAGKDPHTDFAAHILGVTYEDAVKMKKAGDEAFDNARQTAKVANFGFPGGLGLSSLVLFARKNYGVILTESKAKELKAYWLQRWVEMNDYFNHVAGLVDAESGEATVKHLFSERWRGACTYCAASNTFFQGLGSDAAKRALCLVQRACYTHDGRDGRPYSVLFGSRSVNFVHDEIILETDDTPGAHDVAIELARVMVEGANEFLPDVPARTEPLLSRCWSKKAKPVFGPDGRLVPWEPK